MHGPILASELGLTEPLPPLLLTALPHTGYQPAGYRVQPATVTRALTDGDVVDLGDQGGWTALDVLHNRPEHLGMPILGGLPLGHGSHPIALPVGTTATLDADAGTLTVTSAVR